jgi:glycosyltransferase involved in cell wall biosynthesis
MNAVAKIMPARRPLRVLHLRDSPWVDGPGRTILETGSHIDPQRVEYHIGALISGGKHPLVEAAQARRLNVHAIEDARGIPAALVDRVIELMDKLEIDVLHTSEFRSNVLALMCRRRRPVKIVCTVHGWIANDFRGRVFRVIDKSLLPRFDGVIMVSQATRRLVPRWWLSDRKVEVLPNALVLGVYGRDIVETPRPKRDVSAGAILLNVGRLSPEKGQDVLLRAVAALAPRYPKLKLQFAGIGPMEAELRSLAASLGIADRVEFLGYIDQMPKLYSQIDLVVQSSFTEGMPNVILEAAYLRVPIVATAVGGTAEVVEHGKSGWLLPPHSLEALIAGIERYLRDPDEFARMGDAAHARVCAEFSFDVRTRRLMDSYDKICGVST